MELKGTKVPFNRVEEKLGELIPIIFLFMLPDYLHKKGQLLKLEPFVIRLMYCEEQKMFINKCNLECFLSLILHS